MRITLEVWLIGMLIALASSVSFAQGQQKQLFALYSPEPSYQPAKPLEKDANAAASSRSAAVSLRDQRLFQDVTRASQTEIMASRMAEARATDPAVRRFARDMVRNHTSAVGMLNGYAQRKNITLSLQPNEAQQKMLERLNALSGEEFDQLYIREAGIKAHEDTLGLLKRVQKSGQDEALKLLAQDLQAPLELRIEMIKEIAKAN